MDSNWIDLGVAAYQMLGQLGQAAMSYGTHKADRKFNEKQAQIQREWQEKMWNAANEYNSPLQAMQRFSEAGLNPNLIYGDGATSLAAHVGNAAAAQAPADRTVYPNFGEAMVTALGMKKMQAEIDRIEAQELVDRQTARNLEKQREGIEINNMFNRDSYQLRLDQLDAENKLKLELSQTEQSKRDEIEAQVKSLQANVDYLYNEIDVKNALTDAQIKKINTEIDNSIKQTAALCASYEANARKANAEAWLARAEAAIKDDPHYRDAKVNEAIFGAYKAMQEGDKASIEKYLLDLKRSYQPLPGESGWWLKKFTTTYIEPVTSSVGKMFSSNMPIPVK